jgi:hypothetical protein
MSLPFQTNAEAILAVERQFLDWFPYRIFGQIDTLSPSTIYFPETTSVPAPMFAHTAAGFAVPNNGKLLKVVGMTSTSLTIFGNSLTTEPGDGDELLLLWPCPVYFITTDDGGKWVVGQLENGKPYIELEIVGGESAPYENVGGSCSYRHDMVLDVRLFTPEGQRAVFDLQDRADVCFREWAHPNNTLVFEGGNKRLRRRNQTQTVRPGYRESVASYRYWYVSSGRVAQ